MKVLQRIFTIVLLLLALPFADAIKFGGAASEERPLLSLCSTAQAWWFEDAVSIGFDEMYESASSRGIVLSQKLKDAEGKKVAMTGFMAPPLTPTINFFVLTREPMSICPFCSSDADWPSDIVVVKLTEPVKALPFDRPIKVTGILELGTEVDAETGFVSLVRIAAENLEAV